MMQTSTPNPAMPVDNTVRNIKRAAWIGGIVLLLFIPSCTAWSGYNAFQRRDELVGQATAQLNATYQKRHDLIGQLVEVTERYAKHESSVFLGVAQARAGAQHAKLPENATAEEQKQFMLSQQKVGAAMVNLFALQERYPDLKADQRFADLSKKWTDMEAQVQASRNRVIREITAWNTNVRTLPTSIIANFAGYKVKPQLEFDDTRAIRKAPRYGDK